MRLLHTSDWHLGKHFYGRSLVSDQEYVLDQMINLVRDLNPDVMLVAGDVFHQRRPTEDALRLFHDTINRLLNLVPVLVFLSGPTDDFRNLHLDGRWVRKAGIYLFEDSTQVLSPLPFRGTRDNFDVNLWCLPFPKKAESTVGQEHPALIGHALVEKVVQRLNPSQVNVLGGYAWAQDCGKKEELGTLISPGGRPLEKRLLQFFDASILGGRHEPQTLGGCQAYYSGSLLCYEPDSENPGRSVTYLEIESKNKITVDQYPLRPRRSLRVLTGSWEELVAKGRELRSDDLIVLRSEERDLSPEQRAELRILGPNVVSVELPYLSEVEQAETGSLPPILQTFQEFVSEVGDFVLDEESLQVLLDLESRL